MAILRKYKIYPMNRIHILLCVMFGVIGLYANSQTIDGISYTITDEYSVGVSRLVSTTQKFPVTITIPSTVEIDGKVYNVTSILDNAFSNISWCYGVVIPNSVTRIGEYAFSKCDDLHHITIGNGLQSIGNNAFKGCQRLNKVIISDIRSWCNITFGTIRQYGDIIMKADLAYREQANPLYWGHHLYIGDLEITELSIPTDVTEIKDCTFIGGNFNSVIFHDKISRIGDASFCNCSYLKEIVLPNSVTFIGESAFSQIEYLTKLSFGNSFGGAGIDAFNGDNAIREIYSLNSIPPKIQFTGSYFGGFANDVFKNAVVYIPYGSIEEYSADYVWGRFLNLIEMGETGIENIGTHENLIISVKDGNIIIDGNTNNKPIQVISINGCRIYSGYDTIIKVPQKGVYIVSVLETIYKVIV